MNDKPETTPFTMENMYEYLGRLQVSKKQDNTNQYGISLLLQERIQDANKLMNKNLNECLFGDDRPKYVPTFIERVFAFFKEANNRISNSYDCLVKGVDPYEY